MRDFYSKGRGDDFNSRFSLLKSAMKKTLKGKVISDKMQKTAVVEVQRFFKHLKYKKYIKRSKKFKAHDENKEYKIGDEVLIEETKPMSKDKHFRIIKKI